MPLLFISSTKHILGHSLCVALSRIMGAFGIWTRSILSLYLLQKTITIWGYEKCMHVLVLKKNPLSNRCIGNRNILEDNHPYIPPSPIIIKYEKYHHPYSLFHSPIWNTHFSSPETGQFVWQLIQSLHKGCGCNSFWEEAAGKILPNRLLWGKWLLYLSYLSMYQIFFNNMKKMVLHWYE